MFLVSASAVSRTNETVLAGVQQVWKVLEWLEVPCWLFSSGATKSHKSADAARCHRTQLLDLYQQQYQTESHTVNHNLTITLWLSGKVMPIIHMESMTFGVTGWAWFLQRVHHRAGQRKTHNVTIPTREAGTLIHGCLVSAKETFNR